MRLIIWQNSHLRFTDALTFISYLFFYLSFQVKKHKTGHRTPSPGKKLIPGPDAASFTQTKLDFLCPHHSGSGGNALPESDKSTKTFT